MKIEIGFEWKIIGLLINEKDFWNFELVLIRIENDFLEFEREIGIGLGHFVFENDWKIDIVFIKIRKFFNNKICGMLKDLGFIGRYVPDLKFKGFKGFLVDFDINVWVRDIGWNVSITRNF